MDGGLVPSQTYKNLVACADDAAVLPVTGAHSDFQSLQGRLEGKIEE